MISCHFEFKAIHGIWGMFVDYKAVVTVGCFCLKWRKYCSSNFLLKKFGRISQVYAVLVSLFHTEHVQHVWPAISNVIPACFPMLGVLIFTFVKREREGGTYHTFIFRQSLFYFYFFKLLLFFWDFPPTFNFISIHGGYIQIKKTKYKTSGNQ